MFFAFFRRILKKSPVLDRFFAGKRKKISVTIN